ELRRWLSERGQTVLQDSDVAVIPGLYAKLGDGFAEKLVGAFAVALWDPRINCLILVRDRVGERPLFFTLSANAVAFATELAALGSRSCLPITLDRKAHQRFLQFGIFPSPHTPFTEVQKVAPGEIIHIDVDGLRRRTYWRWQVVERQKST